MWPPSGVAGPQRRLEVDRPSPGSSSPSVVSDERLVHHVGLEAAVADRGRGEAGALDSRPSRPRVSSPAKRRGDREPRARIAALDAPATLPSSWTIPVNITTPAAARARACRRRCASTRPRAARPRRRPLGPARPPASGRPAPSSDRGDEDAAARRPRRAASSEPASSAPPSTSREVMPAAPELGERGAAAGARGRRRARSPRRRPRAAPRPGPRSAPAAANTSSGASVDRAGRAPSRAAGGRAESKTTRAGWRTVPGSSTSRAVSSGSSASAVPMPTATASASARQRWTSARLSGPEIQRESPPVVAVKPSRLTADFSVTSGRPVRACLRKGCTARRAAAASAPSANSTSTPSSRRMPGPRPEAFSARVVAADHDAGDARREDRVGARRLAALVGARLEA